MGHLVGLGLSDGAEPGCANRRLTLHCGRMLGGTSAMNAMAWVKGSDLDYDGWSLPGWSWADLAPVFARIEQRAMNAKSCLAQERIFRRTSETPR